MLVLGIVGMISGKMPYAHYSFPDNLWSCRRACSETFVTKANLACYLGLTTHMIYPNVKEIVGVGL